ncbi:conserved hypothetical protein [Alteracholeplasma palmae J233]|uniref:GtrA/DPMS transmembrane domain-containing protein n=1 Tax=Alteracholeplasma palmae (strain ATCC 49389 / J233) TaxID=1318466 RepID=U4KQH7_ALTPJ|nr:GtrA family protein [Alteracholeplasma palmae]CCV64600.1 conserved hypothetical protein [Alteracholeplasma palmae J233]
MENKQSKLQILKFTLFSISAGIIQILSFTILNELLPLFNQDYGLNYIISLVLSILWNFTFNRKYTFKPTRNVKVAMLLILLFYCIFTPITVLLGNYAQQNGINEYIILAVTMILNFVLEFLYTKYFVYKKKKEEA